MKIRVGEKLEMDEVTIIGKYPLFKTPFLVGKTVAEALAARAVAANDLWNLRNGRRQKISVDVRAAATCLDGSSMTLKRDNFGQYQPIRESKDIELMVALTQPWKTADVNATGGMFFTPKE